LKFPATEYDDPDKLLSFLGSVWSGVYQGSAVLADLLYAKGRLALQTQADIAELTDAVSRLKLQALHREEWFFLTLRESYRQSRTDYRFGDPQTFSERGIAYDETTTDELWAWQMPPGLRDFVLATNRIHHPSRAFVRGIDFVIDGDFVVFRKNPFQDRLLAFGEVVEDGAVVDRTCGFWLYRSLWDRDAVRLQFGYVVGADFRSGENAKKLVNAVFDCLVRGTHQGAFSDGFSALADVPFAAGDETVERITTDRAATWIVTDRNAYRVNEDAEVLVEVGDRLRRNQPLCDAVQFVEFGRGRVPDRSLLKALAVGREFTAGYLAEFVFENAEKPLIVETVDGWTKVSFELGGPAPAVEQFWEDVHQAGIAAGTTLAMLLDRRPAGARDSQPTAVALPRTINPLAFLAQNVFRNNLFVVKLRPGSFGPNALGLSALDLLSRYVPPHTAMLVVAELKVDGDEIDPDEPDDDLPGVEEILSGYVAGEPIAEVVDGDDPNFVASTSRLVRIHGICR
jgi:hypothetical protein